jgi:hypothetical protein
MANAIGAVERLETNDFFEIAELALGTTDLQPVAIAGDGDASRVIPAIFQTTQSVHDYRNDTLLTDISNDSTHI